jgi:drug/metabolite transporter (DMT)-like permease
MNNLWVLLSGIVTVITATSVIVLKYIDESQYDNYICLAFTFTSIGVLSILYLIFNIDKTRKVLTSYNRDLLKLILFLALIIILNNTILQKALKYSPNITYSHLIVNLNIILTLIASYFLFRQKINWWTFAGIIITLIGIFIVIYNS